MDAVGFILGPDSRPEQSPWLETRCSPLDRAIRVRLISPLVDEVKRGRYSEAAVLQCASPPCAQARWRSSRGIA
jgi:hypothetical protein